MMVVVAYLRLSGFFAMATERIAERFSGPRPLLAVTIGLSGVLSAFLVNDVVCVALTPLVLDLTRRLKRPPIPYLVGLATASNVGSVATITGNPQNIIIGSLSHISYLRFAARLAPVAVVGLVMTYLVVSMVYRGALDEAAEGTCRGRPARAPGPSRADDQERGGGPGDGRPVLRRDADRPGGAGGGGGPAAGPGPAGEGLRARSTGPCW